MRSVLERYQGILLFEALLGLFEIVVWAYDWLPALLAVALVPASIAAYLVGRWFMRLAGEHLGGKTLTLRFGMRHLMVFVCVSAVVLQLVRTIGWSLVWLLVLAVPPIVVVGGWLFIRFQSRTQQDGLIAVLGMAARRGLPLGPAISAYAGLCRGSYRARALAMANRLESGSTLPEALDAMPGVLPPDASTIARAGWDTNQLGPALERASQALRAQRRDMPSIRGTVAYPLFVLGSVMLGVTFLGYFIAPKMKAILSDYGLPTPGPSQAADRILGSLSTTFWMPLVFVLDLFRDLLKGVMPFNTFASLAAGLVVALVMIAGFLLLCWWLVRILNSALNHVVGTPPAEQASGGRRWWPRRSFSRDRAAVLRSLAIGVESGLPMTEILDRLARSELSNRVRWAVRWVEADLRSGRPWIASLARRRLIRPVDASVLASAERVGNLAWCLQERADALDRRRNLRLRAFALFLQPLAAIALGVLVLLVALVYFLPLVAMISAMVDTL